MYNVNHNQSHMTLYLTRYLVYRGHFCQYLISKDWRKLLQEWMNDGWNMDEGQYSKAAIPFQSNKILISYWKLLFHC